MEEGRFVLILALTLEHSVFTLWQHHVNTLSRYSIGEAFNLNLGHQYIIYQKTHSTPQPVGRLPTSTIHRKSYMSLPPTPKAAPRWNSWCVIKFPSIREGNKLKVATLRPKGLAQQGRPSPIRYPQSIS